MRFVLMSLVVMLFAFYELSGGADFVPRSELRRDAVGTTPAGSPTRSGDRRTSVQTASLAGGAVSDAAPSNGSLSNASLSNASLSGRPVTPIIRTTARASDAPSNVPSTSRRDAMAAVDDTDGTTDGTLRANTVARLATQSASSGSLYPAAGGTNASSSAGISPDITLVSLQENPSLFAQPLSPDRAPEAEETISVRPSLSSAVSAPVNAAPDPARAPADDFLSPQRDIRAVDGDLVNMRNGPGTSFSVLARLNRNARVEIIADPGDGWVKLRPLTGGPEGWMADYLLTRAGG